MRRLLPAVARSQWTYGFMLFVIACHHAWMALTQWFAGGRYDGTALDHVYAAAPLEVWAVASAAVWALITLGVYWRWNFVRAGLLLGMAITLLRALYIELGTQPGAGLGVWLVIVASHFVLIFVPVRID